MKTNNKRFSSFCNDENSLMGYIRAPSFYVQATIYVAMAKPFSIHFWRGTDLRQKQLAKNEGAENKSFPHETFLQKHLHR